MLVDTLVQTFPGDEQTMQFYLRIYQYLGTSYNNKIIHNIKIKHSHKFNLLEVTF